MKTLVIEGFGFMGRVHAARWRNVGGVKLAAICVRNPASLARPVRAYGCVGDEIAADLPPGTAVYTDRRKMLEEIQPDLVDITLPTAQHRSAIVEALKTGAYVMCEKPLSLDAREADAILRAVGAKNRLMVAQCLRFMPEYAYLKQLIRLGRYGRVTSASFTRLTPPPCAPTGASWFHDERTSGGLALDLGIHDLDIVNWLFGLPASVEAHAHRRADGLTDHLLSVCSYPDKVVTTETSWAATVPFGFEYGYRVFLEGASLVYDPRRPQPLLLYPMSGAPVVPKLAKSDCYENEIRFFYRMPKSTSRPSEVPMSLEGIRDSIALVDAVRKSAAAGGRSVKVKGLPR